MDSAPASRGPGLALRWVEVTDERGRSRLEMRWSEVAADAAPPVEPAQPVEPALPVEPAAVLPASPTPPRVTPAA